LPAQSSIEAMRVLSLVATFACASALKTTPHNVSSVQPPAAHPVTKQSHQPTQHDVDNLRSHLEKMSETLGAMAPKLGASKLGPEMQLFVSELRKVLKEVATEKNPAVAMKKLNDARAGLTGLTTELTARQEELMKDSEAQKDSLLVGVLMTKQKEPMEAQFDILKSADFMNLPASKELLAKHNTTIPLYVQVANYLDAHKGKEATGKIMDDASALSKSDSLAASFQKRVESMQQAHDAAVKRHNIDVEFLKKGMKADPKEAKAMKALLKREERKFKKLNATQMHDIASMKDAVAAIQHHDMKALLKAKAAMEESVKSLQSKNNHFLVFAELGSELTQRDCPYCVAQCVDKCHQEGKPYTTCLTTCADAGK
jgi:hypothetical protein